MKRKIEGLLVLLFIYVFSFLIAAFVFVNMDYDMHILLKILLCDVIATISIWIFGVILDTASIYDPYWSIQTPVIFLSLMIYYNNFNVGNIIFLIAILYWALRLTINFIITFDDIKYIDWRYKEIKNKTGLFYQPVNLLGINMMPTLLVYLASVPAFLYVINDNKFSFLNVIGLIIIICATTIELISDLNMHKFRKIRKSRNEIINVGLWRVSRHPNYFGEILFWYGVLFVYLFNNIKEWYVVFGAICINMLFLFISIPLAERRMSSYKEGFGEYKAKTRMLIPLPKKK